MVSRAAVDLATENPILIQNRKALQNDINHLSEQKISCSKSAMKTRDEYSEWDES